MGEFSLNIAPNGFCGESAFYTMRWTKIICELLLLSLVAVSASFANTRAPIFVDTKFTQGFMLSYPDSSRGRSVEAVLNFGLRDRKPCWRLCQWGTKYTLAAVRCIRSDDGCFIYENKGKKVVVGKTGSETGDLVLEVRGGAEYGVVARKYGESWPHLLIEQDAVNVHRLDELDSIWFEIGVRLLHCKKRMTDVEYDPGLHAAQFQMFFIVKNINPDSDERGSFYWFGVPFFDNRHKIPPAFMAKDIGKADATGKFIYTVAGETLGVMDLRAGKWVNIQVDLLGYVKSGVQEAVKRGYLKSLDLHDYAVVNMNLGWEIPGTFGAAAQIRGLNIFAVTRDDLEDAAATGG